MIEAFLSSHGLKALKDELKEEIKNFVMFGATSDSDSILDGLVSSETSYEDIEDYIFYKGELQSGYFDSKGLLTYEVNLNNIVSDYYAYGLMILDKNNKSIATIKIPKIKFFENIGGELTIKLPVQGEKNQVIFTHNEYVTRVEFDDYRRQEKVDVLTKANQTLLLALAARDKTKSIKEDFLKIGRKDYFVLSLPENYVGLEEKIDASKNLILWHKLGIKTKTFELLKKGIYTKGGDSIGYQEERLPDVFLENVGKDLSHFSLNYRGGGGADSAGTRFGTGVRLSDYNKIYSGDSVEVRSNILIEGIYKGNF